MIAIAAIFVVMTLAVLAIIVLPLLRGVRAVADRGDFDRAVYRDQLAELDRDLARGLIGEREAQAARIEIQRRLLATDTRRAPVAAAARRGGSPRLALAVSVLVAIAGAGLYSASAVRPCGTRRSPAAPPRMTLRQPEPRPPMSTWPPPPGSWKRSCKRIRPTGRAGRSMPAPKPCWGTGTRRRPGTARPSTWATKRRYL